VDGDDTNSRSLVRQVGADLSAHNTTLVAAGVAFYALLAIFPALIAMVLVYALVADPADVAGQLAPVLQTLPSDAGSLLLRQLQTAVAANDSGLTIGLTVSLLATVWAATGGVSALMTGLTIVYDAREERGFVKVRTLAVALTFGALVSAVVALGLIAAFPVVLHRIGLDPAREAGAQAARWATLVVLVAFGLSVLYRFGAHRPHARWRPVTLGAVVAIAVWVAAAVGFSVYVSTFGSYSRTYGSLAAVVVLLMWLYLSAFAILLGAEVDAVRARRHPATALDRREATVDAVAEMRALADLNATRLKGPEVTVAEARAVALNAPLVPARAPEGRQPRVGAGRG
jgi:membrane protein